MIRGRTTTKIKISRCNHYCHYRNRKNRSTCVLPSVTRHCFALHQSHEVHLTSQMSKFSILNFLTIAVRHYGKLLHLRQVSFMSCIMNGFPSHLLVSPCVRHTSRVRCVYDCTISRISSSPFVTCGLRCPMLLPRYEQPAVIECDSAVCLRYQSCNSSPMTCARCLAGTVLKIYVQFMPCYSEPPTSPRRTAPFDYNQHLR